MEKKYTLIYTNIFLAIIYFITQFFGHAFAQTSGVYYHPNPIIGVVEGEIVTFEDIRNKKVHDLSLQLYQNLTAQFVDYSLRKLAKKNSNITLVPEKKVSHKEIVNFFEQNISRSAEPLNN